MRRDPLCTGRASIEIVNPATAPTMARLREEGVDFRNSHSLFPTFTTANASAFATGHELGDTGDFSNLIYTGVRVLASNATVSPILESAPVLRAVSKRKDKRMVVYFLPTGHP